MINIQGLEFSYRGASRPALCGVDLKVPRGGLFGLLGPNGAGKTTLLGLLCGLHQPDPGRMFVDGMDLATHARQVQSLLALVPQEYAFYPSLTVAENLHFFAGLLGLKGDARRSRIEEVTVHAGLQGAMLQRAEHCSGGLKRRLNIAIGLLSEPRLLLLDEPTVGIDPQSRHFILDAIRAINAAGTTVVYTSHYMEEVQELCDEVAIIDQGRVLVQGPLEALLSESSETDVEVRLQLPLTETQRQVLAAEGARWVRNRLYVPGNVYDVAARMQQLEIPIAGLCQGVLTLEDLFIQLTHRSLRD